MWKFTHITFKIYCWVHSYCGGSKISVIKFQWFIFNATETMYLLNCFPSGWRRRLQFPNSFAYWCYQFGHFQLWLEIIFKIHSFLSHTHTCIWKQRPLKFWCSWQKESLLGKRSLREDTHMEISQLDSKWMRYKCKLWSGWVLLPMHSTAYSNTCGYMVG